jgi:hypothetical protein
MAANNPNDLAIPSWFIRLATLFMGLSTMGLAGATGWGFKIQSQITIMEVRMERIIEVHEEIVTVGKSLDIHLKDQTIHHPKLRELELRIEHLSDKWEQLKARVDNLTKGADTTTEDDELANVN